MSEVIEIRRDVPFTLGTETISAVSRSDGTLHLIRGKWVHAVSSGEYLQPNCQLLYPATGTADPAVIGFVIERSNQYLAAEKSAAFVTEHDLHTDGGPVPLRSLFRRLGGTVIQPGGLTADDAGRFAGRTARIHGRGDITWFLKPGEPKIRERETLALLLAHYHLRSLAKGNGDHGGGPHDVIIEPGRLSGNEEIYAFAAVLLVPREDAALATDIPAAEKIGAHLLVEPGLVQVAHQLWAQLTDPDLPRPRTS